MKLNIYKKNCLNLSNCTSAEKRICLSLGNCIANLIYAEIYYVCLFVVTRPAGTHDRFIAEISPTPTLYKCTECACL
jgi:hypothetical protein